MTLALWKAFGRRFATYAGTAILTFVVANWQGWFTAISVDYPAIAGLQGLLFMIVEFVQKYLRERAK